jgi:hypothetical protein
MQIGPAINSSLAGLRAADRTFDAAAQSVAGDVTVDGIVDATMLAPAAFTANASAFRTADEMRGDLLDLFG